MRFRSGDLVLLVDTRGRRYLVTLAEAGEFHSHRGPVPVGDLVGASEGSEVRSAKGKRFRAWRPTLADFVLKMPRGAAVVYPKDLGPILVYGDVFPGARVLEAGTGSGALTLALLRAVGPKGTVHTVEAREDHQRVALENIERFAGDDPNLGLLDARIGDVYAGPLECEVDRAVLDLTEPWRALDTVEGCLRPGGILCAYVPTVPQVQRLTDALDPGRWAEPVTFETLHRTWNVEGLSVRPDHRMVGHTAFLVIARRVAPQDEEQGIAPQDEEDEG